MDSPNIEKHIRETVGIGGREGGRIGDGERVCVRIGGGTWPAVYPGDLGRFPQLSRELCQRVHDAPGGTREKVK